MTSDYNGLDLQDGGVTTLRCIVEYYVTYDITDITDSLSVHIEDDTQNPLPNSTEIEDGKHSLHFFEFEPVSFWRLIS